ncbi:transposase family protein [Streptomyces sp. NBC_00827]|uniref:transposase family protein n=1 Tax=Streptomyces sp. NBC_00827 TaxID=2903677 RepID=UPI00386BF1DF
MRVPCWGRWQKLSADQQAVNRAHAKIRALAERAIATLKTWRILRKLRCSTTRITSLVQAILSLHTAQVAEAHCGYGDSNNANGAWPHLPCGERGYLR